MYILRYERQMGSITMLSEYFDQNKNSLYIHLCVKALNFLIYILKYSLHYGSIKRRKPYFVKLGFCNVTSLFCMNTT